MRMRITAGPSVGHFHFGRFSSFWVFLDLCLPDQPARWLTRLPGFVFLTRPLVWALLGLIPCQRRNATWSTATLRTPVVQVRTVASRLNYSKT